jgi:hypothetical protein
MMAGTFDMFTFQDSAWPELLDDIRYLESAGAGTIWIADHYVWPPTPEVPVLESWTTLHALVGAIRARKLAKLDTSAFAVSAVHQPPTSSKRLVSAAATEHHPPEEQRASQHRESEVGRGGGAPLWHRSALSAPSPRPTTRMSPRGRVRQDAATSPPGRMTRPGLPR